MNKSLRQHADERLGTLVMTEGMKQKVRDRFKGQQPSRLPSRRFLQVVLALLLLLATLTAFALTRGFGLFELMGTVMPHFATVRPEAEELLHRDLAFYSFEHVDVAITEAAYDGRYLRVAYSITDRAAKEPLDEPGKDLMSNRPNLYDFKAAFQDKINWSTLDWAEVNGEHVNPLGMSFSVAGPNPGEAITWVQFDVRGIDLPDPFTVRLPIRGWDTPKELDFTMDKTGMQNIFFLKPPPDKRIGKYVVHVQEVMITPIRTYITLHLLMDPGLTPEEIWKLTNPWGGAASILSNADGSKPLQFTDTGYGPIDNMIMERVELLNGEFDYQDRVVDPNKPVTMLVIPEYSPPENYPEAFRLGHSEKDFILIPFEKLTSP